MGLSPQYSSDFGQLAFLTLLMTHLSQRQHQYSTQYKSLFEANQLQT